MQPLTDPGCCPEEHRAHRVVPDANGDYSLPECAYAKTTSGRWLAHAPRGNNDWRHGALTEITQVTEHADGTITAKAVTWDDETLKTPCEWATSWRGNLVKGEWVPAGR